MPGLSLAPTRAAYHSFRAILSAFSDVQVRAGIKPKDHARDNLAAIREASARNNLRKQLVREGKEWWGG